MRFTPGDSWTWSYRKVGADEYLGLRITLDNGLRYFFKTHFKTTHLAICPKSGEHFCVLDGQLLNDFMQGLDAIGVYDSSEASQVSINMELALNALACYRFVPVPKRAIENAFVPYEGPELMIYRGMVTSLHTKNGMVRDFIVLDGEKEAQNGIFRVMFINRELGIGNRILSVGALIKVPRRVIHPFRMQASRGIGYA